jgi:hypothetical protein
MAKSDDVWFTTTFIGCNKLGLIVYNLTFNFLSLKEKVMSNKLGEVGITCVEESLMPRKYGI